MIEDRVRKLVSQGPGATREMPASRNPTIVATIPA